MKCPYCEHGFLEPHTETVSSSTENRLIVVVSCPYCRKPFGAFQPRR